MTKNLVPPVNSRLCRRLAVLAMVMAAGVLLINGFLWLDPDTAPSEARGMADLQCEPITLTPMLRWIGFACSTLYLCVLVRGLWIARSLFKRLAEGLVFQPETGVLLRRFGLAIVVYAAATPPFRTLMTLILTVRNAPGERLFRFGLSNYEILLAIVGTLILTTGSVMAEAARLAEDNRQII